MQCAANGIDLLISKNDLEGLGSMSNGASIFFGLFGNNPVCKYAGIASQSLGLTCTELARQYPNGIVLHFRTVEFGGYYGSGVVGMYPNTTLIYAGISGQYVYGME